jgi:DNA polymerase III delta subunit
MLVTLYGPDSYRRLQKLKTLVDLFIGKRGNSSYERIRLEDDNGLALLKNFLSSASMFSPKKLVVLDEPFEFATGKEFKVLIKKYEESQDTTIVINTTKKYPATFKFLSEEPSRLEEFPTLKGDKLMSFISKEAKSIDLDLNREDLNLIAESLGGDTWRIVTELEQLALNKNKNRFGGRDFDTEVDYFPALNALRRGSVVQERLIALEKLMSIRKDDPGRIFNGLAFKPSSADEVDMYANYDVAVKAGKLDYEEVLLSIALGLEFDPLVQ